MFFAVKNILNTLFELSKKQNCELYLVGGFIRDLLRGEKPRDIDLAVKDEALQFAKKAASELNGRYIMLDRANEFSRVKLDINGINLDIDFSNVKDHNIVTDLSWRDFTINAMALKVEDYLTKTDWTEYVIDPFNGQKDLEDRILRLVSAKNIEADPVRIIRAVKYLFRLNMNFSEKTLVSLRENSELIKKSVQGKVFQELWSILAMENSYQYLSFLEKEFNSLSYLFPSIKKMNEKKYAPESNDSIFDHGVKTVKCLEELMRDMPFSDHLSPLIIKKIKSNIKEDRTYLQLLKFAALYHDVGKIEFEGEVYLPNDSFNHELTALPYVDKIANYLSFDKTEKDLLINLVKNHMRPVYIFEQGCVLPGTIYRLTSMFKDNVAEIMLLSLANFMAVCNIETHLNKFNKFVNLVLEESFFNFPQEEIKPILNFDEIMEHLSLTPSRMVGIIYEELLTAQIYGNIKTKKEAFSLINEAYERNKQ